MFYPQQNIRVLGITLTHKVLCNRPHFPTIDTLIDGLTARPNLGARTRHTRGFSKVKTRGLYKRIFQPKTAGI